MINNQVARKGDQRGASIPERRRGCTKLGPVARGYKRRGALVAAFQGHRSNAKIVDAYYCMLLEHFAHPFIPTSASLYIPISKVCGSGSAGNSG